MIYLQASRLMKLLKISRRTLLVDGSFSKGQIKASNLPSSIHHYVTALEKAGLVNGVVSLSQESLYQKAGYPQVKRFLYQDRYTFQELVQRP